MCSTPKGSALTAVKKIPVSAFSSSDLSDFIAVANAADERREQMKRDAKAKRLRNERADRQLA